MSNLIPKARLRAFARNKIKQFNGNVSKNALDVLIADVDRFVCLAVESSWIAVEKTKRKTILEQDAQQGLLAAKNLIAPETIDALIWKLKEMKQEVGENNERRRILFEKDGRGRKTQKC